MVQSPKSAGGFDARCGMTAPSGQPTVRALGRLNSYHLSDTTYGFNSPLPEETIDTDEEQNTMMTTTNDTELYVLFFLFLIIYQFFIRAVRL